MSTTNQPVTPVVTHNRRYDSFRIENVYVSEYADMLYLYDPETQPEPLYSEGNKTLSLSRSEAEQLRNRLNELLG